MPTLKRLLPVGSRSLLFGAHCFFIHPFFVAFAWYRLWGFKKVEDPYVGSISLFNFKLWIAFIIHDWGYWGKSNMDGVEGELHPWFAAKVMGLFDEVKASVIYPKVQSSRPHVVTQSDIKEFTSGQKLILEVGSWSKFCLFHSRFYSKILNHTYSTLCVADKLATALEPWWFYLPRATLSGEVKEYMKDGERGAKGEGKYAGEEHTKEYENRRDWFSAVCKMMRNWAYNHRDLKPDLYTLNS